MIRFSSALLMLFPLLMLMMVCGMPPACADALADGNIAEDSGDYASAFRDYQASAEQGNKGGEVNVARLYLTGKGVAQSCPLAIKYYALAAKQGVLQAIHNFGIFNANGICMPQNYANAVHIFTILANNGYPKDEDELGNLYDHGFGVKQDFSQAVKWFTLAANQNDATAQGDLGLSYEYGKGEPQDDVQAYKWFEISLHNHSNPGGNSWRQQQDALLTQQRGHIGGEMTPDQIAQAQAMAAGRKPAAR